MLFHIFTVHGEVFVQLCFGNLLPSPFVHPLQFVTHFWDLIKEMKNQSTIEKDNSYLEFREVPIYLAAFLTFKVANKDQNCQTISTFCPLFCTGINNHHPF